MASDKLLGGNPITDEDPMQVAVMATAGTLGADIAAIKTAVEILENVVAGAEAQVDVVAAPTLEGFSAAEAADISAADHTFSSPTRAFIIGVAGTLHVDLVDAANVTFPDGLFAANTIYPGRIVLVHDDSTATAIWGLW